MYVDPTYDKQTIDSNAVWRMAYYFSELFNDSAPLGWSKYIQLAERTIKEAREL